MSHFLYTEIDIIALVLIAIIFFQLKIKQRQKLLVDERLFMEVLIAFGITTFLDASTWLLDGTQFWGARQIHMLLLILYYIFNPLCCLTWFVYSYYKLTEDWKTLRDKLSLLLLPCMVAALVIVSSAMNGCIFNVSENNYYVRGRYFFLIPVVSLIYVVISTCFAVHKIKRCKGTMKAEVIRYMILFPLLLSSATIIQSIYFGTSLIWIVSAILLLLIFINLQNHQIYSDQLTGLNNRRQMESYAREKMRTLREDQVMFALLLDIDDFKEINDRYGHIEGDRALVRLAKILTDSCDEYDFIGRLGGDEFLIIGRRQAESEAEAVMNRIEQQIHKSNHSTVCPYLLSISMGIVLYEEKQPFDMDELLCKVDEKMYLHKQQKKKAVSW